MKREMNEDEFFHRLVLSGRRVRGLFLPRKARMSSVLSYLKFLNKLWDRAYLYQIP